MYEVLTVAISPAATAKEIQDEIRNATADNSKLISITIVDAENSKKLVIVTETQ
jgi:hypothetical protein